MAKTMRQHNNMFRKHLQRLVRIGICLPIVACIIGLPSVHPQPILIDNFDGNSSNSTGTNSTAIIEGSDQVDEIDETNITVPITTVPVATNDDDTHEEKIRLLCAAPLTHDDGITPLLYFREDRRTFDSSNNSDNGATLSPSDNNNVYQGNVGISHAASALMAMQHFNERNPIVVSELGGELVKDCNLAKSGAMVPNCWFYCKICGG